MVLTESRLRNLICRIVLCRLMSNREMAFLPQQ